ncbi:MAG: response regulator transcription factor [Bacteroidetes bacterium]|jgi:DNA-binding LytR/AlgR family response regulator|nr:response regulator transcription factor [Bacteroidota bacterium]
MELKCIIIDDEPHAISELEDIVRFAPSLTVVKTFMIVSDAISFLQENGKVDFIFSDINMPGINGIDSGAIFKKYCRFLVYVSAYRKYAMEAFDVSASAYLIKPVSRTMFLNKMDELISQINTGDSQTNLDDVLFVKGNSKGSFIRLNYNKIIFIQGLLNYVVIHTQDDKVITYMGLKDILVKTKDYHLFIRINKSVIVSANFISHVDGNTVYLTNNVQFSIGSRFKSAFHEYLTKRTLNNS